MTSNTAGAFADSATFFDRYWKRAPYLGVRPDGRATLPTAGDLLDVVDCGLLTHHYFSVLDRGTPVPVSAVTRVRDVVGNKVVGMADGELVLGRHAAGATILLHEPDQWHAGIRELVRSVTAGLDGTIRATAALVPAGAEIAWAADPDVQRFLVTLTGPAFCAETAAPLEAGQVLYLPHAHACTVQAGAAGAGLLAITVRETTPAEVAQDLIERFLKERVAGQPDTAERLRDDLSAFLAEAAEVARP